MAIKIDYLANHPQHIPTVIDWVWDEWDREMGYTYEETSTVFAQSATVNGIPCTILALEDDKLVGMAALLESDFLQRPEPGPWRGNLLVRKPYRGQGIATRLLAKVNHAAWQMGHRKLFVWSAKPSRYIGRSEYTQVGEDAYASSKVFVYEIDLTRAARDEE